MDIPEKQARTQRKIIHYYQNVKIFGISLKETSKKSLCLAFSAHVDVFPFEREEITKAFVLSTRVIVKLKY